MLNKIFTLLYWSYLLAIPSYSQSVNQDSLWEKLTYVNDTLKSPSKSDLQLLLKIESGKNSKLFRGDSTYAFLLSGIGHLYYEQGDFLKGAQYYRQSIDLITSSLDKQWMKTDHLIMCYFRLNTIYDSLNRVSDEMKALDSCIAISRRQQTVNRFCLAALYKKIEFYFDIGDYNSCIQYATLCEMLAKLYASSSNKNAFNYGTQYAYSSLLWNVLAQIVLKNYDLAERLLNAKLSESIETGNSFNLGTIYAQMAEVQRAKGDYKKAFVFYNKALNIQSKAGNVISCKEILNSIGYFIYFKNNSNADSALCYFRKALSVINRDNQQAALNSVESLNILANIGNVYAFKGHYDSAFSYYQLALDQIKPGINEIELLHIPFNEFASQKKIGYITGLLLDKGDAYLQLFKLNGRMTELKEAVRVYKATDQLLDRIKMEQTDLQSKLFWRSDSRRLYEHAIEACYNYKNTNDAFYFFEKSRAVLLSDQLNEQHWLAEGEIQQQTQIKKKILQLSNAYDLANKDSSQSQEIQSDLFKARQDLYRMTEIIKERNPLYYQSFIDLKVTTVDDVRKDILNDHKGLVEIFSGDSSVYILTVKADQSDLIKINKNYYDSISHAFMNYISNASLLNDHFNEFAGVSRQLYRLIFRDEKMPKGRVVISPDGQYFPFEALITSSPAEKLNYFLNDYAVSYTYSAKYLINHFVNPSVSNSKVFLGIAPVKYPAGMQLATLTGSDLSLAQLQTYFKSAKNLVLSNATKSEFMNIYSKYRIIQLYTHAVDSGLNGEPVVYFADSALSLSELLGEVKPVTDLVVLSACESGKGKLYKGEGVFSFNRGFAALGIPSSVSNLWSVENQSTYHLTELFYKYLAEGKPIDIALQKAKLEFINSSSKQSQLPYYWASAILIGKNNPIELNKTFTWKNIVLIAAIFSFLLVLVYRRMYILKK